MELPKNITQIGETNPYCKIYVEDYVVSYIKQLNQFAQDKSMAVALYGIRKEENGISYLFLYGAGKLNFLQRESRHLSQAVLQEAEKQRRKHFADYDFLGYRLLNGEMIEGFHVYEQGVCRYIEGYAQFYEKNDSMLAFMLEERQEEAKPEEVSREKYDEVKRRQEERRAQAEARGGHAQSFKAGHSKKASLSKREELISKEKQPHAAARAPEGNLHKMKLTAAAVFALLCVAGLVTMSDGERVQELQMAARQFVEKLSEQQLPDVVEVANGSVQVGTIVAEDKLTDALVKENAAITNTPEPSGQATPEAQETIAPTTAPTPEPTSAPTPEPTPEPEITAAPTAAPVSYTVKRGDTLIGICIRKYGSDARVSEICSLNNIENPDDIKEGEKILLP